MITKCGALNKTGIKAVVRRAAVRLPANCQKHSFEKGVDAITHVQCARSLTDVTMYFTTL